MLPGAQRFMELQQPGQLSHTHVPPMQRSPTAHAVNPPHVQIPAVLHVSPRRLHATHIMPLRPHVPSDEPWHMPVASQHPVAQLEAEQATPVQRPASHLPDPQFEHESPPLPHAPAVSPLMHCPPALQQPFGHDVELHIVAVGRHVPASQ